MPCFFFLPVGRRFDQVFSLRPDPERPVGGDYRGTSLIGNIPLVGPYSRTIPRVLWWSLGGQLFLTSEVPLQCDIVLVLSLGGPLGGIRRFRHPQLGEGGRDEMQTT